ncbi:MAG: periplasmic heavy metal sensor [Caulobacter sp.]|nr:periplasmic heavy metal sensor [Caulobacter sp.]
MTQRRLTIALLVSLALNLFLVGLGVGAWALGPRLMQPSPVVVQGPGRAPLPFWASARALSPQYRPAFSAMLRGALADTVGDIREARKIKRQAFDAMSSGDFDAGRVTAELDRARTLEFGARARLERDMLAFSATLPLEERANLAEAMRGAMTQMVNPRFQRQWEGRPAAPQAPTDPRPAE